MVLFQQHLGPFIEVLGDESPRGREALQSFFLASKQSTLNNIRSRLTSLREKLSSELKMDRTLPRLLVEFYLKNGVNCVLAGMRTVDYVKTLI